MKKFIITIIGFVVLAAIFAIYFADKPEILSDLADVALVRCEVGEQLSEALANVGVNQDQRRILDAIAQGEAVLVKDVRDVGDRIKNTVKPAMWTTFCNLEGS